MQVDSATLNNLLCVSWKLNTLNKITETSLRFQNGTGLYLSLFERKKKLKLENNPSRSQKYESEVCLILIID